VLTPTTLSAAVAFTAEDQSLLTGMRMRGYAIYDLAMVIRYAHETCRLLNSGKQYQQVQRQIQSETGWDAVLGIHWWEGDGGDEKAVPTGLQISSDLRGGRSQEAIINGLVWGDGSTVWKPNEVPIITDDARKIVGSATVRLCPDAP
jgi:hypothetical protein